MAKKCDACGVNLIDESESICSHCKAGKSQPAIQNLMQSFVDGIVFAFGELIRVFLRLVCMATCAWFLIATVQTTYDREETLLSVCGILLSSIVWILLDIHAATVQRKT